MEEGLQLYSEAMKATHRPLEMWLKVLPGVFADNTISMRLDILQNVYMFYTFKALVCVE